MEQNATLAEFYTSWKLYQYRLTEAIVPLTREQLAVRAAPGLGSVAELAAHMIAARAGWFTEFLGEDWGDAGELNEWDAPAAPARDAAALVRGLETSWHLMAEALARWSPAHMEKTFPREWRGNQYDLSRSWVVWHLIEHDLHHGGEISLTLGMHGLTAPDI